MKTKLLHLVQLLTVIGFALIATLPFAGQAFSLDGPLVLDYARHQAEHPLDQALPDFDYFGIRYDNYLNTHPRFLSLYLSLILRVIGEPSEVPVHAALAIFPVIGGIGMFYLGRRFRVSGLAAALLFLASPMLMVSSHTEMVDVPGISLWVAALAAFIYGVDKRRKLLLALAALLLFLTSMTFFQGLTALALALIYLLIKRRFRIINFLPIVFAGLLFAGYIGAVYKTYHQLPRFSYRPQSVFDDLAFFPQLIGNLTLLGGTALFPLAASLALMARGTTALAWAAATAVVGSWSVVKYTMDFYSGSEALLLTLMLPIGIAAVYMLLERPLRARFNRQQRQEGAAGDALYLAAWFFGVLIYATVLLSYPAPRYMLPALPALVISLLLLWRGVWRSRWLRFAAAAAAIVFSFTFSVVLSLSYGEAAGKNPESAAWVSASYPDSPARFWYDGELEFGYYMKRQGFTMAPGIRNELYAETEKPLPENPRPGDYLVSSPQHGAWLPYPEVLQRMRNDRTRFTYNYYPITLSGWSRWEPAAVFLPYRLTAGPELNDEVTVWRIDEEAWPLLEETKEMYRSSGAPEIE